MTQKGVREGFNVAKHAINILQNKIIPKTKILCEPQLGKRGLYPTISNEKKKISRNFLDFLQYCDGNNTIENISKKIKINLRSAKKIFYILKSKKIVY